MSEAWERQYLAEVHGRIYDLYGLDTTDPSNGSLLEILKRVDQRQPREA